MQTSGVKEERIMGRREWAACWCRVERATSTKVLSSMATGATPASVASWRRGYSFFRHRQYKGFVFENG